MPAEVYELAEDPLDNSVTTVCTLLEKERSRLCAHAQIITHIGRIEVWKDGSTRIEV